MHQHKPINTGEAHINALCNAFHPQQINEGFIIVFDGGPCFIPGQAQYENQNSFRA